MDQTADRTLLELAAEHPSAPRPADSDLRRLVALLAEYTDRNRPSRTAERALGRLLLEAWRIQLVVGCGWDELLWDEALAEAGRDAVPAAWGVGLVWARQRLLLGLLGERGRKLYNEIVGTRLHAPYRLSDLDPTAAASTVLAVLA